MRLLKRGPERKVPSKFVRFDITEGRVFITSKFTTNVRSFALGSYWSRKAEVSFALPSPVSRYLIPVTKLRKIVYFSVIEVHLSEVMVAEILKRTNERIYEAM